MSKNKQWASKLGFIMATAGAAIGWEICGNFHI